MSIQMRCGLCGGYKSATPPSYDSFMGGGGGGGGGAAPGIETNAHHSSTTAVSSSAAVLKDFTILLREQLSAEPHGGAAP